MWENLFKGVGIQRVKFSERMKFPELFLDSVFPKKVSLTILNYADNTISDLFSVYLKTVDHLNLKLVFFSYNTASFKL